MSSRCQIKPKVVALSKMEKNSLTITINNNKVNALIDTGAEISCISKEQLDKICKGSPMGKPTIPFVYGVSGQRLHALGTVSLDFYVNRLKLTHHFHVFPSLHCQLILGYDFLTEKRSVIDLANNTISVFEGLTIANLNLASVQRSASGSVVAKVSIPAQSECNVPISLSHSLGTTVLIEPLEHLPTVNNIMGARTVVKTTSNKAVVRVINPTNRQVTLKPGKVIATAYTLSDSDIKECEKNSECIQHINSVNSDSGTDKNHHQTARELGFDLTDSNLSNSEQSKLLEFLGRNRDIFAKDLSELGCTDVYQHKINTESATPVRQRFYRTNPKQREEIDRQVQEMLENDIIEPSNSEWHSPVVLVKKKSGEFRFAVDYRRVNKVTKPEVFPLPRLDDILDTIGESSAKYFSVLDMCSGFWQIPLDSETKHKSAFVTHNGLYQFKKLPFGLSNAPMSFQMVMTQVLKGVAWRYALCYIDDILVFSKDLESHLLHLEEVFQKLRNANLKLKPSKCKFATQNVQYLGHMITPNGIEMDPSKIAAVTEFPTPKNQHDIRSFLGLCNYYRRFIKGFSEISNPMNKLLQKDVSFEWTPDCESAFKMLKVAMTSAPVLAYPNMNASFILSTDASGEAISFILGQKDKDGREHPIAFGGRALKPTERKWSITERECLALVEGIRHYRHFLEHQHFTVLTDHAALKWLGDIKHSTGRLARWSMLLQGFNYTVVHKPGKHHQNADVLSRVPYQQKTSNSEVDADDELESAAILTMEYGLYDPKCVMNLQTQSPGVYTVPEQEADKDIIMSVIEDRLQEVQQQQSECPDLAPIRSYLEKGQLPEDKQKAIKVVAESERYTLLNGLLYHLWDQRARKLPKDIRVRKQLAIPTSLRLEVLKHCHDALTGGAHQGFDRTYNVVSSQYYWPRMYTHIHEYVSSCLACQRAKQPPVNQRAPLHPLPPVNTFERWHMDILGPLTPTKEKYQYILLCVDSFSRFVEAFPLKTQEAAEIADILYREIICRYGAPKSLVSDRGRNFMSNIVSELCRRMDIKRYHTSAYHPQSNSTCERFNRTLASSIRTYIDATQQNWADLLPGILMAYRKTSCIKSTKESPFQLVFGSEMRAPLDVMLELPQKHLSHSAKEYVEKLQSKMEITRTVAKENVEKSQDLSKVRYDKTTKEPGFILGERVWVHHPKVPKGQSAKLHCKWSGPYYITDIGPNHTYQLHKCGTNKKMNALVHANRLKSYKDPDMREQYFPKQGENAASQQDEEPVVHQQLDPEPRDITDSQTDSSAEPATEWGVVKKLLAYSRYRGRHLYKVQWEDSKQTTWEPKENLPAFMVRDFHVHRTQRGKARKRRKQCKQ